VYIYLGKFPIEQAITLVSILH